MGVVVVVDRSHINCIFRREAEEDEGDEGELERLRKGKYIPSRRIVHLGEQLHSIYDFLKNASIQSKLGT